MRLRLDIGILIFLGLVIILGIVRIHPKIKTSPHPSPLTYKDNSPATYSLKPQANRQLGNSNIPNNSNLLRRLGETEEATGNMREALNTFNQFHKRFFWKEDPRIDLASQCTKKGNFSLALKIYKKLVREKPYFLFARYRLAEISLAQQHSGIAIYILESIIREYPRASEAKHLLAITEQNLGHYTKALQLLQSISKVNPKNATYLSDLGVCEYLSGNPELAVHDLKEALDLNPKLIEAAISLISIDRSIGKGSEALRNCQRILPHIKPSHLQKSMSQTKALKTLKLLCKSP